MFTYLVFRSYGPRHVRSSRGSHRIDDDVVLGALAGDGLGEADDAAFGGGVVGLAEVAVDAWNM